MQNKLKAADHLQAAVDLAMRWGLRDKEIVSISANEHSGSLHIEPWAADATKLMFKRRTKSSPHYTAMVGSVDVCFIDERRFYRELCEQQLMEA